MQKVNKGNRVKPIKLSYLKPTGKKRYKQELIVSTNKAIIRNIETIEIGQPRKCGASSVLLNRHQRRSFFQKGTVTLE